MGEAPVDLRHLVEQCLDNDPSRRPPISDVSEKIRRMKEVETVRCPDLPDLTWQATKMTRYCTTNGMLAML